MRSEVNNVASVPIGQFPPSVRALLAKFDKDGDGTVDAAELQEAALMFEAARAAEDGSIPIGQLPKELRPALKTFDTDGDGTIDPMELARGAELYAESKNMVKKLTRLAVGLLVLISVTIAAITGLTATVVELSKEVKAGTDGTMLINNGAESALMSTSAQAINATLDSRMTDETLHALTHFAVISPNGAHVRLNVLGTMRLPRKCEGEIGSLVIIVTAVGQITLEGTQMTFENEVGSYFAKAGFSLAESGRRLNGLNEIIAVFSSLKEADYLDYDGCTDGAIPSVPQNAAYDYTIFFSCANPANEFEDRCKHFDDSLTAVVDGERYAYVNVSAKSVEKDDGSTVFRKDMRMDAMAFEQIKTYVKVTSADGSVEIDRSYQTYDQGRNSGNVTWCSESQTFYNESDLHGAPKGPVVAYYDGVVDDTPVVGGSTRKFSLYFEAESGTVWEYYDKADTAEVAVIMQQSRLGGRVYFAIRSVTPLTFDDLPDGATELPDQCDLVENEFTPWVIPGTYHITNGMPFPHNQALTASTTYLDGGELVNGEALLHEVLIESGANMYDYNAVVDELPVGASLEEIGAALGSRELSGRRSARSLLAAEDGLSFEGRVLGARDRYHDRWTRHDTAGAALATSEPEAAAFDAHDGAAVAETSALEEARREILWNSAWEWRYANLGSACKGKNSGAKHGEYFGIEFTAAKNYRNGVPCYVSAEASADVMRIGPVKLTISASVEVDIDAVGFESISASGSISFTVSADIGVASLYGSITFSVSGSVVSKGGHKWKYGGYYGGSRLKHYGTNAPRCNAPLMEVSVTGKVGVEIGGVELGSLSVKGSMPIKFNTPNCKDYLLHYWKTYFCGKCCAPPAASPLLVCAADAAPTESYLGHLDRGWRHRKLASLTCAIRAILFPRHELQARTFIPWFTPLSQSMARIPSRSTTTASTSTKATGSFSTRARTSGTRLTRTAPCAFIPSMAQGMRICARTRGGRTVIRACKSPDGHPGSYKKLA